MCASRSWGLCLATPRDANSCRPYLALAPLRELCAAVSSWAEPVFLSVSRLADCARASSRLLGVRRILSVVPCTAHGAERATVARGPVASASRSVTAAPGGGPPRGPPPRPPRSYRAAPARPNEPRTTAVAATPGLADSSPLGAAWPRGGGCAASRGVAGIIVTAAPGLAAWPP